MESEGRSDLSEQDQKRLQRQAELGAINFLLRESIKLRRALTDLELYLRGTESIAMLEGVMCGLWLGLRQVRPMDRCLEAIDQHASLLEHLQGLILDCTELWRIERGNAPHPDHRHALLLGVEGVNTDLEFVRVLLLQERRRLRRESREEVEKKES